MLDLIFFFIIVLVGLYVYFFGVPKFLISKSSTINYKPKGNSLDEQLKYAFYDTYSESAFWWIENSPVKNDPLKKENLHLLHEKYLITDFSNGRLTSEGIEKGEELKKKFLSLTLPNNIDYTSKPYYMDGKSTIHRKCIDKKDYVDCIFEECYAVNKRVNCGYLTPFYTLGYWQIFDSRNSTVLQKEIFDTFLENTNSLYAFDEQTKEFYIKDCTKKNVKNDEILETIRSSIRFVYDEDNAKELDSIIYNLPKDNKEERALSKILSTIKDLYYCPYSPSACFLREYKIIPDNGVYLLFDLTEEIPGVLRKESRIVYIGKNEKDSNLLNRINNHYNGTISNSVFRKHIASCMPSDTTEENLSEYIKKNVFFEVINVPEYDKRTKLESMLISTVSKINKFGRPTKNWLGLKSEKFRDKKLWNVQNINDETLDNENFLIYKNGAVNISTLEDIKTITSKSKTGKTQNTSDFLDEIIQQEQLRKKEEEKEEKARRARDLAEWRKKQEEKEESNQQQKDNEWKIKVQQDIEAKQRQKQEEDERWKRLRAENEARKRCDRCANSNACGFARGTVNCGAFVPKKYN